jgi:(p)ppGpp synthase/HD superfamily hydrolase
MQFSKKKYKNCLEFLFRHNCHSILHSKSTFLNHLINTFKILKKWKQREDLCYAGMFHNIYGNKYFNANLKVSREDIQNLIGEKAEELVFKFVNIERKDIAKSKNKDLIILAVANDYEQNPLLSKVLTFKNR